MDVKRLQKIRTGIVAAQLLTMSHPNCAGLLRVVWVWVQHVQLSTVSLEDILARPYGP